MEEFRLGGVESGLVILCHMVSLIAIFFFLRCDREVHQKRCLKGEKTQSQKLGRSLIVLMLHILVSDSFQAEPKGSRV